MFKSALRTLLLTGALCSPAMADVTISTNDGGIRIRGELLKFEGGKYYLRTAVGDVTVDASLATCEGDGCPEVAQAGVDFRLAVTGGIGARLVPSVIDGFLTSKQLEIASNNTEDGRRTMSVTGSDGAEAGAIEMLDTTSAEAFEALLRGDVDIIFTDRRATNAEVDAFIAAGRGNILSAENETIFAQDAIAIVTSPLNPVRFISVDQAEGVFSGRITNWSELGGPDRPIRVFLPATDSAITDQFRSTILDPAFADFTGDADRSEEESRIGLLISGTEDAIGLTSSAQLGGARPLVLTRSCGIEARPTSFNIRSEDYPMARRIYAYASGNNASARELTAFLTGLQGQRFVDASGFVSLEPEATDFDRLGKRLAFAMVDPDAAGELQNLRRFAAEAINAERLSTTFRFATGSSQLDNKARADAIRLASLLQRPDYAGAEVLLVGFTDSIGNSDVNSLLSQRRAGQVLDEIVAANPGVDASRFSVLGFGEAYPAACNTDASGRDLNRRVEVWIR